VPKKSQERDRVASSTALSATEQTFARCDNKSIIVAAARARSGPVMASAVELHTMLLHQRD
jgi:hypothetical protein